MLEVKKIISKLDKIAPPEMAQQWDNSGWQINLGKEKAQNVLFCLSLTPAILNQALEKSCDLIITHHPLIFDAIKKIENHTITQQLIINCIQNDIQVYSAHTNLDIVLGGVNDILCEKLGLQPTETINEFVKITELLEPISLDEFILKLKINLNISKVKIINPNNINKIKRIATCSGSGANFINTLSNVDLFLTGDIKYHNALDVQNMVLIDAGHFETEKIVLESLRNYLIKEAPNAVVAKEISPWIFV